MLRSSCSGRKKTIRMHFLRRLTSKGVRISGNLLYCVKKIEALRPRGHAGNGRSHRAAVEGAEAAVHKGCAVQSSAHRYRKLPLQRLRHLGAVHTLHVEAGYAALVEGRIGFYVRNIFTCCKSVCISVMTAACFSLFCSHQSMPALIAIMAGMGRVPASSPSGRVSG